MKKVVDAMERELFWEQPNAWQRRFVLLSGDEVLAQFDFGSAFSSLAEASSGEGRWTFKRVGFFSTQVIVQQAESEVNLASYLPNWIGSQGKVQVSTGEKYIWSVVNFLGTKFTISREDGLDLITYLSGSKNKKFSNIFKQEAQLFIAPEAYQIKELMILVLLGWYLVLLHREDSAVVAASSSIGAMY